MGYKYSSYSQRMVFSCSRAVKTLSNKLSLDRFGAGFCFTVVYAALFTKTNRISRIFNAGKRTAKRPSFITPRSQLIICSGLVSVQVSSLSGNDTTVECQ